MRTTRLARGLAAAGLAVAIGTAGIAQPARAVPYPGDVVMPPPGPTVGFTFAAYNLFRGIGGAVGGAGLEVLIERAIEAIFSARDEVISRMDRQAAADVKSDADELAIDFMNYDILRQTWGIYQFASRAHSAANDAYSAAQTVTDRAAVDQIGHAMNTMYSITQAAAADAGWTPQAQADLNNKYIEANEYLVQRLEPTCTSVSAPLAPPSLSVIETKYTCVAADGNMAVAAETYFNGELQGVRVNVNQLKVDAAINSSWVVALEMLPILRNPNP